MQVHLILPGAEEFPRAVETLYGRAVDAALRPALPYSVVVRNEADRSIALLGIRFDMTGIKGNRYSVVHYADTLRHPDQATLHPGAMRFVCAEPGYTELVLKGMDEVSQRTRMNLDNLRRVLRITASIDCIAFDDGRFEGVDSRAAFERLERQRLAERQLVDDVISAGLGMESVLTHALSADETKNLARSLYEVLEAGGESSATQAAKAHRCRIRLFRDRPDL